MTLQLTLKLNHHKMLLRALCKKVVIFEYHSLGDYIFTSKKGGKHVAKDR